MSGFEVCYTCDENEIKIIQIETREHDNDWYLIQIELLFYNQ